MISIVRDSFLSTVHRPAAPTRLAVLSILSIVLTFGCGNDGSNGTNGGGATNGAGATNGGGATNGSGAAGGNGAVAFTGAVLCTALFSPDGVTGFVRLVSDAELEAGGEIESFQGAIEIGGGVSCATRGNSVFAASFESPTMTRYDVVDGALVQGETVSFFNFGLSSLASLSSQIQVFSDTKAYYFDPGFTQIIVWNPATMETIEAIPLPGFEPPEGLLPSSIRAARIDDRMVVWGSFANQERTSVAGAVFAFVNLETDEVVTDTSDDCGGFPSAFVTTPNGDTYFGTGTVPAVNHALGLEGSYEPCALRVRAGATEIDSTYVADLNQLTGVGPTGGPFGGSGTKGLLLAWDASVQAIDPLVTAREHTQILNWRLYEVELGSTEPGVLIDELPPGGGRANFITLDGTTFLAQTDLGTTTLLDVSERPIEVAYTIEGSVVLFARLQGEPLPRMAQRIEPRGSLNILPSHDFGN